MVQIFGVSLYSCDMKKRGRDFDNKTNHKSNNHNSYGDSYMKQR